MRPLTVEEVRNLAHKLAEKLMKFDEPIPAFETRYPAKLESCLAAPFQTFGKKDLYPSLNKKSAVLFYTMVKGHPFQNGNKRIALMALLVFLDNNKKWINVHPYEFYQFAIWIAKSPANLKDGVISIIEEFLDKTVVD